MSSYILLGLLAAFALQGGGDNVLDWGRERVDGFFEASFTPTNEYREDGYLIYGLKQVKWQGKIEEPARVNFVSKPTHKDKKDVDREILVEKTEPKLRVTKSLDRESIYNDFDDLGIIGNRKEKVGVTADEVLSFFEKTVTTKNGNEVNGAYISTQQPSQGVIKTESRANLEIK